MITLFGYAHFLKFVSFLLYPTEVKRLKCAMLGAFTVTCDFPGGSGPPVPSGSALVKGQVHVLQDE